MISRGPKPGTLWRVNMPGLVAATLNGVNRHVIHHRWYLFDNITFLEKDATVLYIGDETLMVSHWELLDLNAYYASDEFYKELTTAVFLYNDKKVYIFYDDHYDIWEADYYLVEIK
jgi:hypothetical protein